ncbi:MAG: TolC family protein [Candidatus Cyclobacteriaceae bacterium M3_2C_046]
MVTQKKKWLIISLLLISFSVKAQEPGLDRLHLIEAALEKSNEIYIQEKKASLSRLDRQKARMTYLPKITFNSSYTILNDDISFAVPPIQIPVGPGQMLEKQLDPVTLQERNIFRANIEANMVIFSGLKAPLLASAAYHKYQAETALLSGQKADIIAAVMGYYDRLALLEQSAKILADSRKRLDKQTEYSQKAFEAGLVSAYDLNKIKIAQRELNAKEIELAGKKKLVLLKLSQLTGINQEQLSQLQVNLNLWPGVVNQNNIHNRAELKALDESILANNKKRQAELAGYLPQVAIFGRREIYEDDLSALDPVWYAGIGLKWHLFDGLQRSRDVQKARIETEIAIRKKEDALEQLALNHDQAYENLQVADKLIEVAQQKLEDAREGFEITTKEYQVGLTGITERLAAESDLQKAEMDYLQAVYDQRVASLRLLNATGELTIKNIKNK